MTPTAVTSAGRSKPTRAPKRNPGARVASPGGTRTAGHRSKLRQPPGATSPRRVSGPLGGISGGRVSIPVRPPARSPARPGGRSSAQPLGRPAARPHSRPAGRAGSNPRASLGARAFAFVWSLPDHQLLDRIVRGRAWIPLLGVLLAGIVAMQVEVLKLGAGIGRSIEASTALQSRNELLRASVATLADDGRIERLAAGMGMVMPAPAAVEFASPHSPGSVQRAVANIHPPDPTAFTAALPAADTDTAPAGSETPASTATATPTPTPTPTGVAVTSSSTSG